LLTPRGFTSRTEVRSATGAEGKALALAPLTRGVAAAVADLVPAMDETQKSRPADPRLLDAVTIRKRW